MILHKGCIITELAKPYSLMLPPLRRYFQLQTGLPSLSSLCPATLSLLSLPGSTQTYVFPSKAPSDTLQTGQWPLWLPQSRQRTWTSSA